MDAFQQKEINKIESDKNSRPFNLSIVVFPSMRIQCVSAEREKAAAAQFDTLSINGVVKQSRRFVIINSSFECKHWMQNKYEIPTMRLRLCELCCGIG